MRHSCSTQQFYTAVKIKFVQWNAVLATDAIRETSREKLCKELVFEYLKERKWLRRLCYFHKILSTKLRLCLYYLLRPL